MPTKSPTSGRKSSSRSRAAKSTKAAPGSGRLLAPIRALSRAQMILVASAVAIFGITALYVTQAATVSYSLWSNTDKPAHIATWDGGKAMEVGTKFKASTSGTITGVRFYKDARNTGTHFGHLWDGQGHRLANVTFTNETASGWQQATFATPVAISANTEYVISYFTSHGYYGITENYFKTTARVHSGLTAPASTTRDPNGVIKYGPGGFPAGTYHASNYWVDVMFRPAVMGTPAPTPTPTLTPVPTPAPTVAPTPTPATSLNLTDPHKKDIAMQLVSSAENSSLNWKAQYAYIEDIGDGRGYTGGIVGFCSGTSDMLALVQYYNSIAPGNILAKYIPALQKVNGSASHTGLDPNFTKDWKTAAADIKFQQAQDHERDRVYFNPSVNQAIADGLHALGQFIYYDAMVMHGPGSDSVSFGGIRANAIKKAKPPAQGGNETTYLNAFLDVRKAAMLTEAAHDDTSRVDTEQRVFLKASNLNLNPPLTWKTYGDSYTIAK